MPIHSIATSSTGEQILKLLPSLVSFRLSNAKETKRAEAKEAKRTNERERTRSLVSATSAEESERAIKRAKSNLTIDGFDAYLVCTRQELLPNVPSHDDFLGRKNKKIGKKIELRIFVNY